MSQVQHPDKNTACWSIYIDGASRNNPGPSGAGVYMLKDGQPFLKKGYYLGTKTNNQAEYYALLLGFFLAEPNLLPGDTLHVFSDSQLLIKQLKGEYKIKHPLLRPLYTCAKNFLNTKKYVLEHIMRYNNCAADKLANQGIDDGLCPPPEFEQFFTRYNL